MPARAAATMRGASTQSLLAILVLGLLAGFGVALLVTVGEKGSSVDRPAQDGVPAPEANGGDAETHPTAPDQGPAKPDLPQTTPPAKPGFTPGEVVGYTDEGFPIVTGLDGRRLIQPLDLNLEYLIPEPGVANERGLPAGRTEDGKWVYYNMLQERTLKNGEKTKVLETYTLREAPVEVRDEELGTAPGGGEKR